MSRVTLPAKREPRSAARLLTLSATLLATLLAFSAFLPGTELTAQSRANAAEGPRASASPHGPLSADLDCSACHASDGWKVKVGDIDFPHDASGFELSGRHETVRCAACHLDLRFDAPRIAADDCASCHADVHQGSLGLACASCHDTETFAARSAPDVHARTSFPLTGSHLLLHCESCHLDDRRPRFDALDAECISCHRPDYENSVAVDHVARAFSTDCHECHNTVAWFNRARVPVPSSLRRR